MGVARTEALKRASNQVDNGGWCRQSFGTPGELDRIGVMSVSPAHVL